MSQSNTPFFPKEASLAGRYPDRRFGQRERKILESVKNAYPFTAGVASYTTTNNVTQTISVPGLLATDFAFCQIKNNGTNNVTLLEAAAVTDGVALTFSAAPGTDCIVSYAVFRQV